MNAETALRQLTESVSRLLATRQPSGDPRILSPDVDHKLWCEHPELVEDVRARLAEARGVIGGKA
jgi:hypothetical protein